MRKYTFTPKIMQLKDYRFDEKVRFEEFCNFSQNLYCMYHPNGSPFASTGPLPSPKNLKRFLVLYLYLKSS